MLKMERVALHTSRRSLSACSPSTSTALSHLPLPSRLLAPLPPLPLPLTRHPSLPSTFSFPPFVVKLWWLSSPPAYTLLFLPFSWFSSCLLVLPPSHSPVSGVCCACLLLLGHWQHPRLEAGWADIHLQLERHHVRRLRHLPRHQHVRFMIASLTGPHRPL